MDKIFALRTAGGREFTVLGLSYIGRAADCLICYNDPAVSRHHARIWVEQGSLWLADDNSSNGTFLNGRQLNPSQAYQLQADDRLRLGNTDIELQVVGQASQVSNLPAKSTRRVTPVVLFGIFGCLLILGLGILASSYYLFGRNIPGSDSPKTRIVAIFTPEPLLKPQEYAASSQALVQAVAELNQSELAFILAARKSSNNLSKVSLVSFKLPVPVFDVLDDELRQVAADAMHVASLADSLNKTTAAQGNGSEQAGQVAGHYGSIAQLGAALVIDAQDLRAGLAQGSMTKQQAAAVIAEYGARLWNPAITDQAGIGNPFNAYLGDPSLIPASQPLSADISTQLASQIRAGFSAWVATSPKKTTKKFSVPNLDQAAGNLNDQALLAKMSTAAGQTDGNTAKQAAAAIIQGGGGIASSNGQTDDGQPVGEQVVASFFSAMAVSSPENSDNPGTTPPRKLPSFPQGSASAVSQSSADEIITNLINLDDGNNPTIVAQIPVVETEPIVSISIPNVNVKSVNLQPKNSFNTFEADVLFEYDVKWSTNLVAPHFSLDCNGNNHFEISTTNGSQHVAANGLLILYPGAEDAYCYASQNGNTWGSASVHFLVGDPAEATKRAIQVETDSASLDLTLTADVNGTLQAQQANSAATGTSQAIQNQVSTEVYGTQTAEFSALITEIARQTEQALPPPATETPLPTATFTPQLVETFFHPGDVYAVSGNVRMQKGRLYRICLSGTVYLTTGPAKPSDLDSVNGINVPLSGCLILEGDGSVVTASCGHGVPESDPGGFSIQVFDLGPY